MKGSGTATSSHRDPEGACGGESRGGSITTFKQQQLRAAQGRERLPRAPMRNDRVADRPDVGDVLSACPFQFFAAFLNQSRICRAGRDRCAVSGVSR